MLYLDTGCLVKLYYPEPESAAVAKIVLGKAIIFTDLHELEMATAMQLKRVLHEPVVENRHGDAQIAGCEIQALDQIPPQRR